MADDEKKDGVKLDGTKRDGPEEKTEDEKIATRAMPVKDPMLKRLVNGNWPLMRMSKQDHAYLMHMVFITPRYVGNSVVLSFTDGKRKFVYAIIVPNEKTQEPDEVFTRPTYSSADGEYRRNVITYTKFLKKYEKFRAIYDGVEERVAQKDITLLHEYVGEDKALHKKLEKRIVRDDVIQKLFVDHWYMEAYKFATNVVENHITPNYIQTMMTKDDVKGLKMDLEFFKFEDYVYVREIHTYKGTKKEIGVKISPMTVGAIESLYDICSPTWLELEVSRRLTNMVLSDICYSFPVFGDWFVMYTPGAKFLNNENQRAKIPLSDRTKKVLADIEAARRYTYVEDEMFLSYNMRHLSDTIKVSEEYAKKTLIYSDYSLCFLSEYCGRPLMDLPRLMHTGYANDVDAFFTNRDVLNAKLFELTYASYVMSHLCHVVHGDLHPNNIVVRVKRETEQNDARISVYEIGALGTYVFNFTMFEMAVIDFSRAITGPQFAHERSYVAEMTDIDQFNNRQKKKMLQVYERDFPEFFADNEDKLHYVIDTKYDLAFSLFSAYDLYRVVLDFMHVLEQEKREDAVLNEMKTFLRYMLTTDMLALHRPDAKKIVPHLVFIEKFFHEYEVSRWVGKLESWKKAGIGVYINSQVCYDNEVVDTLREIELHNKKNDVKMIKALRKERDEAVLDLAVDLTPPAKIVDEYAASGPDSQYFDS